MRQSANMSSFSHGMSFRTERSVYTALTKQLSSRDQTESSQVSISQDTIRSFLVLLPRESSAPFGNIHLRAHSEIRSAQHTHNSCHTKRLFLLRLDAASKRKQVSHLSMSNLSLFLVAGNVAHTFFRRLLHQGLACTCMMIRIILALQSLMCILSRRNHSDWIILT